MAAIVAERGFAGATVKLLTARAGVSRRTLFECFDTLEDCFLGVLDLGLRRTRTVIADAFAGERCWQGGLRSGLAAVLQLLDDEPIFARVWLVESLAAGPWALARWEAIVGELRGSILDRWSMPSSAPPLAVEGVMASVLAIARMQLLEESEEPLVELLGPMMGMVCAPFLSPRDVESEVAEAHALARRILAERAIRERASEQRPLPAILCNPSARRARHCLLLLAEQPGSSNREVARGIGVAHQSQVSRLLCRLAAEGLVIKRSEGPGKRNSWSLTERGSAIVEVVRTPG
jgi:AcrR family transcriptional regulator